MDLAASWNHPDEWHWYALRVAPGREFAAKAILRDEGHDVFVPLKHIRKAHQLYARPRLPGYIFVGANGSGIPWADIMRFSMIVGVVSFNGTPLALPGWDMHWLVRRHESLTAYRKRTLSRRQRNHLSRPLRIVTGPYQGRVVRMLPLNRETVLCRFIAAQPAANKIGP